MIDYTETEIQSVSVHSVGNRNNEEALILSKKELNIENEFLRAQLLKFFTQPFAEPEFFNFTFPNEEVSLNPVYHFVSHIFSEPELLQAKSVDIAKQLYEVSTHPQIKAGDLFVAHLTGIHLEEEVVEAIGIFKAENKHPFLKLDCTSEHFSIDLEEGFDIGKLDKGCLIFNVEQEQGFRVAVVDKSNKSVEAHYWVDTFLQLKAAADNYHATKEYLQLTKNYIAKELGEQFEVSKAEQIDLLNKSANYFKSSESFNQKEFAEEVFESPEVIESFSRFEKDYQTLNELSIDESFEISQPAVKKQSKIFKSVLKLDKNFHVYIHGDRDKIEKGEDNGRKYYKLYYENED